MSHTNTTTIAPIALPDKNNPYPMQSPGISVIIDSRTKKVVFIDGKFTNKFGYTEQDVYSEDFSLASIIDEVQLERLNIQISEAYENKVNRFIVYSVLNKDAEKVMCYIYAYPIENQQVPHFLQLYILPEFSKQNTPFISFDTRELFLEQFGTFDFGTFEWIIATNRIFWSEGIYKIYEIEDRDVRFDHAFVKQFTHTEDTDRVRGILANALSNCSDYEVELRIITAKNNIKVIKANGRVIRRADGNALKLVGCVRDMTRQRMIENSLEEKIEELNESNAELEEFAYVASHDLQEPLRKISTFCDRLSERYSGELQGDGKMYMERIMASADNMRMLIHNLLEFSRVSKTNEPFTTVSLNIVIREVINELELMIDETGSVVRVHELPRVSSSFTLIKQLFMNLVNNAIKFRKDDVPVVIDISSKKLSNKEKTLLYMHPEMEYYDIMVRDNGIGFDNEYAGRIFQIFQRLHGKSEYPGSGIGLAICKKIVEKHKGYIYAEGKEGEGAVFHIVLPAHLRNI